MNLRAALFSLFFFVILSESFASADLPEKTIPPTPTLTITQPSCSIATGTINVVSPTGSGYSYSLSGDTFSPTTNTTGVFSNVMPGTYNVTAILSGVSSTPTSAVINTQPITPAAPTLDIAQPICGTTTAMITVTAPTGTGLTYSINGTTYQSSNIFSGVAAGATYNVTVRNSSGCTSPATAAVINAPSTTPAAPTLSITQPSCSIATATITVTAPTGTGLTYSINGTTYQSSNIFSGVAANATYNVTARASAGCTSSATAAVINAQPATPPVPTLTLTQPTCVSPTGSITVSSPTGSGYSYSLDIDPLLLGGTFSSTINTTGVFSNVTPGMYIVTAILAGCTSAPAKAVINTQPSTPAAPTLSITQPTCGTTTATITVTAPTGTGLTYSINGTTYQSSNIFNGVAAGATYNVTVRNSSGCTSPATAAVINAPSTTPAAPTLSITQPSCSIATATITVTAPTGTGLTYSINGTTYQSSNVFSGVAANTTYNVTARVGADCTSPATVAVINAQPATPPVPTLTLTQPTCVSPTGSITVSSPTGSGYSYSLDIDPLLLGGTFSSTINTTGVFSNVTPGMYIVTAILAGCTSAPAKAVINTQPSTPAAPTLSITQPTCGTTTATITITAPTGTGMTYSINGTTYQSSNVFSGVAANATYNVTVRASAGCTSPATVAVINTPTATPAAPTLSITQPNCSTATATITVTAPTGTGLTYSINGTTYQSSNVFSGVAAGATYNVTVRNSSGCTSPATTAVINAQPALPAAPTASNNSRCGSGTVTLSAIPPTGATVAWFSTSTGGTLLSTNNNYTTPSISTNTDYYVESRNGSTCVSSARTKVTAIVNTLPAAAAGTAATRCGSGLITISATPPAGSTIDWFATSSGGTALALGSTTYTANVSATTTFFATSRNVTTGCVSSTRTGVTATVNPLPATPSSISGTLSICPISTSNYTFTSSRVSGVANYLWTIPVCATGSSTTNSISIKLTRAGANDSIYVQTRSSAGCVSNRRGVKITTRTTCTSCVAPTSISGRFKKAEENVAVEKEFKMMVYPNPGKGIYQLTFNAVGNEPVIISVRNYYGSLVMKKSIQCSPGKFTTPINLENFENGIYVIQLGQGKTTEVLRIVKK